MQRQILTHNQVRQKIVRMAYQIYEQHFNEAEIFLIGIRENGYALAQLLQEELQQIASFQTHLHGLSLDKLHPTQSHVQLECPLDQLQHKSVILVDDVLNTGRTLAYSFKPFLEIPIKTLQTAVLVNREHHLFPVSADYAGYQLATTLQEHIQVRLSERDYAVLLL
ncbi:MAG: phosphoribosyltransferase family protein [Bernardetiaceae bacterium]